MKRIVFLFLFLMPAYLFAIKTSVKLVQGGSVEYRAKAEKTLTSVLNAVNRFHEIKSPLDNIQFYFADDAFRDFLYLLHQTQLYAIEKEYRTNLIVTESKTYEVRNIRVKAAYGKDAKVPFQNLVFVFNAEGEITNTHFSIGKHHYEEIIKQGKELNDLAYREKILSFIEIYRTAYNKKDFGLIKKTLSDDALIIVGHVVKTKKTGVDYLDKSYLSKEKIEFIRLSKNEYLQRLKKVFSNNDFMRILFDEINIQRHPQFGKVYGVQLKQRWNSSSYSDEGYLFLMIDFIKPQEPIIHVRAWQPEKFTDGSTINIYDFEIIE